MVYFPQDVFENISSYLIDPDYFQKQHAKVWKGIGVEKQFKHTITIDTNTKANTYFVHSYNVDTGQAEEVYLPTKASFMCDTTGQLDKVDYTMDYSNEEVDFQKKTTAFVDYRLAYERGEFNLYNDSEGRTDDTVSDRWFSDNDDY